MDKVLKKIKEHPRSHIAQAYRLGFSHSEAQSELMPLLKVAIRYFMMRGRFLSREQEREFSRVSKKLKELTYQKFK